VGTRRRYRRLHEIPLVLAFEQQLLEVGFSGGICLPA
jgi:hypothetical protein